MQRFSWMTGASSEMEWCIGLESVHRILIYPTWHEVASHPSWSPLLNPCLCYKHTIELKTCVVVKFSTKITTPQERKQKHTGITEEFHK